MCATYKQKRGGHEYAKNIHYNTTSSCGWKHRGQGTNLMKIGSFSIYQATGFLNLKYKVCFYRKILTQTEW